MLADGNTPYYIYFRDTFLIDLLLRDLSKRDNIYDNQNIMLYLEQETKLILMHENSFFYDLYQIFLLKCASSQNFA